MVFEYSPQGLPIMRRQYMRFEFISCLVTESFVSYVCNDNRHVSHVDELMLLSLVVVVVTSGSW